jgi:hypothetical protein
MDLFQGMYGVLDVVSHSGHRHSSIHLHVGEACQVDTSLFFLKSSNMDQEACPRCHQVVLSSKKAEHDDWHLATDLQAGEPSGDHTTAPVAKQSTRFDAKSHQPDIKTIPVPPDYAPPSYPPPTGRRASRPAHAHSNKVIEAAALRAKDEVNNITYQTLSEKITNNEQQQMQNALQNVQYQYGIYNSDIEPEHETDYPCGCAIHNYQRMKRNRSKTLTAWSEAVKYPGEKTYNDFYQAQGALFSFSNPYTTRVVSPYGYGYSGRGRPIAEYHAKSIHQTIQLNNKLNHEAQVKIDAQEPKSNIWTGAKSDSADTQSNTKTGGSLSNKQRNQHCKDGYPHDDKPDDTVAASASSSLAMPVKMSRLSSFRKSIGIKSSEERAVAKSEKLVNQGVDLRNAILAEEAGRWPDDETRNIVAIYAEKVGMVNKIADLRDRHPLQYLHLLRAGYFEPIPVAWADQPSNPLKFSIEPAGGWRGITPAWRGYEDTAEERLYWVLNHREGSVGVRMKPDFISELNMARDRMATAVDPPPEYFAADDTCHIQHTSEGYSKQVMPAPFRAYDQPEVSTDDTMLLLDVSGSMDFDPVRPKYVYRLSISFLALKLTFDSYNHYLITGYSKTAQPKNKGKSEQNISLAVLLTRCRRRKSYRPPLYRRHGEPRPRVPWLRSHRFLISRQLYWHNQSWQSGRNVAKDSDWRRHAGHGRLAKGQRAAFQETLGISHAPPHLWMASRTPNSHATSTVVARW